MWYRKGFTTVELLVTLAVIAILLAIVLYPAIEVLPRSRDTERLNDTASIARRLEQAYTAQETGAPAYPSTTRLLADIASSSGTVARLESDAWRAPRSTADSSVIAATSTSTTEPSGPGSPSLNNYIYQPLTRSGSLCTGTDTCVRFYIYYRTEKDNTVKILKSIRQQ